MAFGWGYRDRDGPNNWENWLSHVKRPKMGQSPIDIDPFDVEKAKWPRLRIKYRRGSAVRLRNNGQSFVVDVRPPSDFESFTDSSLRRGPLGDDRYALSHIEFHWGRHDSEGSEHRIRGKSYAAEAHFVHYNMQYGSYRKACDKRDGLCILAVFFKAGRTNKALQRLLDDFDKVRYRGQRFDFEDMWFHPKWLLPRTIHRQKFWHYRGSMTTPPCYESVKWIVFKLPLPIGSDQLDQLRGLYSYCPTCSKYDTSDSDEGRITHNARPLFPKNFSGWGSDDERRDVERTVYSCYRPFLDGIFTRNDSDDHDSSSDSSSSGSDHDWMDTDEEESD